VRLLGQQVELPLVELPLVEKQQVLNFELAQILELAEFHLLAHRQRVLKSLLKIVVLVSMS
jgi:hypothetical protein